jgi:Uma2 family endonuclease
MGATTTALTVEDFLKLPEPEGQRIELIEGEVVAMGYGGYPHEIVKANLIQVLAVWSARHRIGKVFSETMFRLDAHNSPIPDVSFVLADRLTPGTESLIEGAPELAIEVVSSESAAHLEKKIELYLAHGGKAVWTVYPRQRVIWMYDAKGFARKLEGGQAIEDAALFPGFSVPVSAIFDGV